MEKAVIDTEKEKLRWTCRSDWHYCEIIFMQVDDR